MAHLPGCNVKACRIMQNSLLYCFDTQGYKVTLRRASLLLAIGFIALGLGLAGTITFFALFGVGILSSAVGISCGASFAILFVASIIGCIVLSAKYLDVKDQASIAGATIAEAAASAVTPTAESFSAMRKACELSVFCHGFYFADISTAFLQRKIDGVEYSSNYQVSLLQFTEDSLEYVTTMTSLIGAEKNTRSGKVALSEITAFELLKPNGIDLFRPHLKLVFGNICVLFVADCGLGENDIETACRLIASAKLPSVEIALDNKEEVVQPASVIVSA